MEQKNQFTQGKILLPLLKFMFPVLLAQLLQSMYGAVDLLVVGQFADASGVAAVSTGSTIMQTVTLIISGLTMGATILIGRKIGEQAYDQIGRIIGAAVAMFTVLALVLTAVSLLLADQFTAWMKVPQQAVSQCVDYVTICSLGTIFIVFYNVISGIFRGIGNSKLPLIFVFIACVVNIVGDVVLVAGFHLGAAGAAAATIAAQAVSVVLSLVIIQRTKLPFTFKIRDIGFHMAQIKTILLLGYPIAMQDALTTFSFLVVNAVVNSMGVVASAGYGVAMKLTNFILLIPSSYMSSMSAFVAQNIGANLKNRAKKAMLYGIETALGVGVFMFLLGYFGGTLLSNIFTKDPQVIAASADYLKGFSFDCLMTSVLFCMMGYFNGCGKTMFVMLQGLAGAFCIRIPVTLFVASRPGATLFQIGLATPLASLFSILLCIGYYRLSKWNREERRL